MNNKIKASLWGVGSVVCYGVAWWLLPDWLARVIAVIVWGAGGGYCFGKFIQVFAENKNGESKE